MFLFFQSLVHTANESNGVGNIVLLATEQMEIGSLEHSMLTNSTDEELTSLTWLHDKNLLKGRNWFCFVFFFL